MSSEGSVSDQSSGSGIRQFGLYRTIDARTEEFLRLSRKRQIRQGCVCAAISTAITVTVVVVVLVIYQFSLNSGTNFENTLKSNWLSLINYETENSSFDSNIRKANIDKTTLKLLPLLIKAIHKNALLKKMLEDYPNNNIISSQENKEVTEDNTDKTTFTKNWFKFPTSKLYAIEYKTSPVLYYRHPVKNIEYYTKISKLRDYKRIFNYVDKMINEKVYIGATRPVLKEEVYTENPVGPKVQFTKNVKNQLYDKVPLTPKHRQKQIIDGTENIHCKCSNLGNLLNKLLLSVQKILPNTTKIKASKDNHVEDKKPMDENYYDVKNISKDIYEKDRSSAKVTTVTNILKDNSFYEILKVTSPYKNIEYGKRFLKSQKNLEQPDLKRRFLNTLVSTLIPQRLKTVDHQKQGIKDKLYYLNSLENKIRKLKKSKSENIVKKKFTEAIATTMKNTITQNNRQSKTLTNEINFKTKLNDSTKEQPNTHHRGTTNATNNNSSQTNITEHHLFKSDLKEFLANNFYKNSTEMLPEFQKVNNYSRSTPKDNVNHNKSVYRLIRNKIDNVVNDSYHNKSKRIEIQSTIKSITEDARNINIRKFYLNELKEGSNNAMDKNNEDEELINAEYNFDTKIPDKINNISFKNLFFDKSLDFEWKDINIELSSLETLKPIQSSSYLQIRRTEGNIDDKNIKNDDDYRNNMFYDSMNINMY